MLQRLVALLAVRKELQKSIFITPSQTIHYKNYLLSCLEYFSNIAHRHLRIGACPGKAAFAVASPRIGAFPN